MTLGRRLEMDRSVTICDSRDRRDSLALSVQTSTARRSSSLPISNSPSSLSDSRSSFQTRWSQLFSHEIELRGHNILCCCRTAFMRANLSFLAAFVSLHSMPLCCSLWVSSGCLYTIFVVEFCGEFWGSTEVSCEVKSAAKIIATNDLA